MNDEAPRGGSGDRRGLVLFAHGARDAAWAAPFRAVAERVRGQRPGVHVELAFLEFMNPDLADAVATLLAAGCTTIDIVPLFLGGGGHVRRDVPVLVDTMRAAHPGRTFRLHAAAGETAVVIDALAAAARAFVDSPSLPGLSVLPGPTAP